MTNKAATKRGMVERIVARASGFDLIATAKPIVSALLRTRTPYCRSNNELFHT